MELTRGFDYIDVVNLSLVIVVLDRSATLGKSRSVISWSVSVSLFVFPAASLSMFSSASSSSTSVWAFSKNFLSSLVKLHGRLFFNDNGKVGSLEKLLMWGHGFGGPVYAVVVLVIKLWKASRPISGVRY